MTLLLKRYKQVKADPKVKADHDDGRVPVMELPCSSIFCSDVNADHELGRLPVRRLLDNNSSCIGGGFPTSVPHWSGRVPFKTLSRILSDVRLPKFNVCHPDGRGPKNSFACRSMVRTLRQLRYVVGNVPDSRLLLQMKT